MPNAEPVSGAGGSGPPPLGELGLPPSLVEKMCTVGLKQSRKDGETGKEELTCAWVGPGLEPHTSA